MELRCARQRRVQDVSRPIVELMATAARQFIAGHVQVRSQRLALRTAPVGLAASQVARLTNDLDLHLAALDAQRHSLARDPSVRRLGSDVFAGRLRAFHQGLSETGYVEGKNGLIRAKSTLRRVRRATMSAPPPGAKPTMMRTGRAG